MDGKTAGRTLWLHTTTQTATPMATPTDGNTDGNTNGLADTQRDTSNVGLRCRNRRHARDKELAGLGVKTGGTMAMSEVKGMPIGTVCSHIRILGVLLSSLNSTSIEPNLTRPEPEFNPGGTK